MPEKDFRSDLLENSYFSEIGASSNTFKHIMEEFVEVFPNIATDMSVSLG